MVADTVKGAVGRQRVLAVTDGVNCIYTIGHSNGRVGDFVDLLRRHDVNLIVDVRSVPYSQYTPQFNGENLRAELERAGIAYRFAGEYLGGRPRDPTCYKNGEVPDGHADYLQLVDYAAVAERDWYRKGIDRLRALAADHRVAVMCSEENPVQCHRHHLIAQSLLQHGVEVRHIRRDGSVEAAAREAASPKQLGLL